MGGRNIIINGTTDFCELNSCQLGNDAEFNTARFLIDLILGPIKLV
jgi:hypothetical protein